MCRECRFRKTAEAFTDRGVSYAPCSLRIDRWVPDKRRPEGRDWQAYVMTEDYVCSAFESKTVSL